MSETESEKLSSTEETDNLNNEAAETIRSLVQVLVNDRDVQIEQLEDAFDVVQRLERSDPDTVLPNGLIEVADKELSEGDIVSDRTPPSFVKVAGLKNEFEVVEVTDDTADEHVVEPASERPENHDLMVSDENPGYPEDDTVIIVSPVERNAEYPYPISRLEK